MNTEILVVRRLYPAPKRFTSGSAHCFSVPQSTNIFFFSNLSPKTAFYFKLDLTSDKLQWLERKNSTDVQFQRAETERCFCGNNSYKKLVRKKKRHFKHKSCLKHSLFYCPTRCARSALCHEAHVP